MSERRKYQGFAFDKPLIDEIKKHIEGKYQYRTVTDFVRQATLKQLEKEKNPEVKYVGRKTDVRRFLKPW